MKQVPEYDGTTILDTQARRNMTTMGKVDTSDHLNLNMSVEHMQHIW